jgi:hypothetical protein
MTTRTRTLDMLSQSDLSLQADRSVAETETMPGTLRAFVEEPQDDQASSFGVRLNDGGPLDRSNFIRTIVGAVVHGQQHFMVFYD